MRRRQRGVEDGLGVLLSESETERDSLEREPERKGWGPTGRVGEGERGREEGGWWWMRRELREGEERQSW